MTPAFGNHHTQSCAARRIGRATQKGNIVRRQPQYDSLGITSQLCKAWRMKASAPSLSVVSAQPQYGSTRPPRPKRQHHRKAGGTAHIVRAACKHLMQSSACQRSEEHTSELQSLMRISYAVFCLKKKNKHHQKR